MKFYILDCFAQEKYQGNELLVVFADRPINEREQQNIAREINFSETTFVLSDKQANGGYDVRIWTPNAGEIPFAGHPTLGTAYIIQRVIEGGKAEELNLNLTVGQIVVRTSQNGMTMTQNPPVFGTLVKKEEIAAAFEIAADEICGDYPIQLVSTGLESVIVPVKSRECLSKLKVNPGKFREYINRMPECNCNHLFFTKTGDHVISARCIMEDFVEDPATGSANGNLAGYMLQYNYFGSGPISYVVYQGEDMGRKSVLHIYAEQRKDDWTIEVGGNCFIVASGDWV